MRRLGLRARLVDAPFGQPLGRRTAQAGVGPADALVAPAPHHFPGFFAAEILTGSLLPLAAAAYVADALDMPASAMVAALAAVWFGSEALLARAAGWHLSLLVAAGLGRCAMRCCPACGCTPG